MEPDILAKLLANAQNSGTVVAPAAAPPPPTTKPVPTGEDADKLRAGLAATADKPALLTMWEAAGWDVSTFRVATEQPAPIPWQPPAPPTAADPVEELAAMTQPQTDKPKRGRKPAVENGARFDLIKACALGGVPVADVQAYLELAGVA